MCQRYRPHRRLARWPAWPVRRNGRNPARIQNAFHLAQPGSGAAVGTAPDRIDAKMIDRVGNDAPVNMGGLQSRQPVRARPEPYHGQQPFMPEDQNEPFMVSQNGVEVVRLMPPPADAGKQQADHQRGHPADDEHPGSGAFELFQHG